MGPMSFSIGKGILRKDAHEKVTGEAVFTADYSHTNMLHIKLVISPCAHAKIINIDVSEAEKAPGVHAVLLGQKTPLTGGEIKDRPVLAYEKVRYYGEPVAAVVADHPYQAKHAAELINVTYEVLQSVQTPTEAINKNAVLIHEELDSYEKDKKMVVLQYLSLYRV